MRDEVKSAALAPCSGAIKWHGSGAVIAAMGSDASYSGLASLIMVTKLETTVCCTTADTLLPILTVEEMLLYTAELKRPLSEPLEHKKAEVQELLEKLALTDCR